jgi:site-specific recombinase XerD
MTRQRTSLPKERWPEGDRRLWLATQTRGSLFEPDGLAAHWADATRIQVEKGYAKWLGFLNLKEHLNPELPPAARITAERLQAFVKWMQDHGLASTTLASRTTDLREAIRVMEPDADLSLIKEMVSALNARAVPSRNKHTRIMHPETLLTGIIKEFEELADRLAANAKIKACWYRDALVFALLVCRPIRLKNLAALRLGIHLVHKNSGWDCHLTAEETKEKMPLSFALPEFIGPYLSVYLERYRPVLLDGNHDDHLWVSIRKTPLSKQGIYGNICSLTERLFNKHINPHLLRDCAASAMATDDPEHILAAARILGHASLQTTNRHYNQSQMTAAGDILHEVLADLRSTPKSEEHWSKV